jgi:ubiquinone biosynthesis protein COQ9
MLNLNTPREKIIDAAVRLAVEAGWDTLPLDRIAARADINLGVLRQEFASKPQILAAFTRAVDDAVMAKITVEPDISTRERLFDVLMTRFEIMAPYKAGLRRIHDDLRRHPGQGLAQLFTMARSQYWMLTTAGVTADGPTSALRIPGILGIYASIFKTWLDDEEPGLSKTMAALDSHLQRGERIMTRLNDLRAAVDRLRCAFAPFSPLKKAEVSKPISTEGNEAEPRPLQGST